MNDSVVPNKISHYKIIRLLGRGGMGDVYLANDTRLDRQVAIKQIRHDLTDPVLTKRLRHEASVMAKLNHPNIVQIYDIVDEEDQLALVMEYIQGSSLNRIVRESITSLSQRLLWLSEIAAGLATAHEAGIIHRDLKPENILITHKGTVKITDFGIAKSSQESLTQYGNIAGSYSSISPEQAMGLPLDHRCDLFSLGILAYQILFEQHPFGDTKNDAALLYRIINERFTPIKKFKSHLPANCIKLIEQLLSKKASARPSDTAIIAKQFRLFSEEMACSIYNETKLNPTLLNTGKQYNTGGNNTAVTQVREAVTQYVQTIQTPSVLWTILLLIAFASLVIFWPMLTKKEAQYIAVLPPSITSNETVSAENQKLIAATVYDALQQSVLNLEGLELIPAEEVEDTEGDIPNVGKALGADEIIRSTLVCSADRCDMVLARLGGERWTVQQQKQFPILTEYLLDTFEASQEQLIALYPAHQPRDETHESISDADYREYLQLYQESNKTGADLIPVLERLDQLQTRIARYQPIYHLYQKITLHLHFETKDKKYLDKLEQVLLVSDNLFPNNIEKTQYWYRLAEAQKDYVKAAQLIDKLEKLGASEDTLSMTKARLLSKQGKYSEAIKFYQKGITLRPSQDLYYGLAFALSKNSNNAEAKVILEKLFNFAPDHYRGNRLLATIALYEGNLPLAIDAYKKLLLRKPEGTNYNNLGLAYALNHDYELAYEQYYHALKDSPNNTTFLINLADTELLLGNKEKSHAIYQNIVDLLSGNNDSNSHFTISQAYAQLGEYEKAIHAVQQTQIISPNNPSVLYNAALIYTIIGETTSALVYTQQALENGIGFIWFRFPWFDNLCQEKRFTELLAKSGDKTRCTEAPLDL